MRVYIAEKPALGKVIAEALGANTQRRNGYFQCGDDAVTWCVGHILELVPPEVHNPDYAKWNAAHLPLKLRPAKYQPKDNTADQFKVVQQLIGEASEIIHAGDPDDEGQLLVDEVLAYCGNTKPVKRLLINDLNTTAAKKASGQNARLEAPCPQCQGEVVISPKLYACTGCNLKVWKTVASKALTDNQVNTLLKNGKSGVIKGFTSKAGKKFDAMLKLEQDGKLAFEFEARK